MYCKIPKVLAIIAAVYILACTYYMIMTRNIGTPFRDSLNKEQLEIKKKSANQRRTIFYTGIVVSAMVVFLLEPFSECF